MAWLGDFLLGPIKLDGTIVHTTGTCPSAASLVAAASRSGKGACPLLGAESELDLLVSGVLSVQLLSGAPRLAHGSAITACAGV